MVDFSSACQTISMPGALSLQDIDIYSRGVITRRLMIGLSSAAMLLLVCSGFVVVVVCLFSGNRSDLVESVLTVLSVSICG